MIFSKTMADVMKACIIFQNMKVEFRRDSYESKMFSMSFFKDMDATQGLM